MKSKRNVFLREFSKLYADNFGRRALLAVAESVGAGSPCAKLYADNSNR